MIKVLDYTKNPLTLMGKCASICYDSKDSKQIAIDCIESGHTRVAEFGDITIEIDEYSARCMRELYTHIAGTSRIQSSTRYINYEDFKFYTPPSVSNNKIALYHYDRFMDQVTQTYKELLNLNIPKEDIANILPLGSYSKVVLKINIRAIIHMAQMRLCNRALKEYRDFMKEFLDVVGGLDDEWNQVIKYCKPKCLHTGYCNEKQSCGMIKTKEMK